MPFKKSAIFEISPALAANQTPEAEPACAPRLLQVRSRDYFTSHMLHLPPKQARPAPGEGTHYKARSGRDFLGED